MRIRKSVICCFLLLLGLSVLLHAQEISTWGSKTRTVHYGFRVMNPTSKPAGKIDVYLPLPLESPRQEIHYLHFTEQGRRRVFTDVHGQRLVHDEPGRPFAFFGVHANVGLAGLGGHLPVNGADIVTGQVGADLLKIKTATPHPGRMPARQQAVQGLAGQKRKTAGLMVQPHQVGQAGVNPFVHGLTGLLMGGAAGVFSNREIDHLKIHNLEH